MPVNVGFGDVFDYPTYRYSPTVCVYINQSVSFCSVLYFTYRMIETDGNITEFVLFNKNQKFTK